MNKLCCFTCPKEDYSLHNLDDQCSTCGRLYGFPLVEFPKKIKHFRIIKALGRGFYSVTYLAEYGNMDTKCVLKIAPKLIYKFFRKNFVRECKLHKEAAEDSPSHIVQIQDRFDTLINFKGTKINCHVAVLDYVKGTSLKKHLDGAERLHASKIAQIAIDLFLIIGALEAKRLRHNDLHGENIIIKASESGRADAIDPTIQAVAVDLGSLADDSKSDAAELRLGDIKWVSVHLRTMVDHLLREPDKVGDLEFRLANLLLERAEFLSPDVTKQKHLTIEDGINDIRTVFREVSSPWKQPLSLNTFKEGFNAQTLGAWFVPHLLVDPDSEWEKRISIPGPQIISGMRGCGKTMLLRSLQFHARATQLEGESSSDVLRRLKDDRFVGLYASCTRLLDRLGSDSPQAIEPFTRLTVAYSLAALQAVRHLEELDRKSITVGYYKELAKSLADYLEGPLVIREPASVIEFERKLIQILVATSKDQHPYILRAHPSIVFPHLAKAISASSAIWTNHYILFLLDDVTTRFIKEPKIQELLSSLLFQSPLCAFKFTTEAQTLEFGLKSPSQVEEARSGRDYDIFDLGAEVYDKVKTRSSSVDFIEKVLTKRARRLSSHPHVGPKTVLGDTSLQSIAHTIAASRDNSRAKKTAYHGITALGGVCVGDIGDVIYVYESILRRAKPSGWPVPALAQSQCYQEFCSQKIFDLNRRSSNLNEFATTFAKAAHKLLIDSYANPRKGKTRLRQYTKIYVRITSGKIDNQFRRLRELIDAGIFILDRGSDKPRSKTRDSNPILQFALSYRKLLGVANYIGLADRDRFELSGTKLQEWLNHPERGDHILRDNAITADESVEDDDDYEEDIVSEDSFQPSLFPDRNLSRRTTSPSPIRFKLPTIRRLHNKDLQGLPVDHLILGLGFEPRTLESARRLLKKLSPQFTTLVQYKERGERKAIESLVKSHVSAYEIVDYEKILKDSPKPLPGNLFLDMSGLAKPVIFHAVRSALTQSRRVFICDTRAEVYYPLDSTIRRVTENKFDKYSILEGIGKILKGEKGPYKLRRLLDSGVDDSRRRVLCAFSSAKHERLFGLLDERDFDHLEIITPKKRTPRTLVAREAAAIAANKVPESNVTSLDSHDLRGTLDFIASQYQDLYVRCGYNFEVALTGSKLQAAACAALSCTLKFAQCWYLSPQKFDVRRFTKGIGKSSYFEISL